MRLLRRTALLALVIALGTVFAGWWTVPVISGAWTLGAPRRAAVISATLAGAIAWSALLALTSRSGPVTDVAALLGEILGVPGGALLTLTVIYAALLAGAAALLAQSIRPPAARAPAA